MIRPIIHHRLWHAPELNCRDEDAARWLGPWERESLGELRDPSRRAAFFAGRMLVKRIILEEILARDSADNPAEPAEIEVLSRDGLGRSVQPRVYLRGTQQPWSVSIAHSGSAVLAAVSQGTDLSLGVDLTPREIRSPRFAQTWLTPAEQAACSSVSCHLTIAQIWALKEAIYKAVGRGAPFVPASIEILPTGTGWSYRYRGVAPRTVPWVHLIAAGHHIAVLVAVINQGSESLP